MCVLCVLVRADDGPAASSQRHCLVIEHIRTCVRVCDDLYRIALASVVPCMFTAIIALFGRVHAHVHTFLGVF